MKLYFGRIINPIEQFTEGYYISPKGSSYVDVFDDCDFVAEAHYVFMIAKSKIELWKVKRWSDDNERLLFDKTGVTLPIKVKEFPSLKFWELSMDLLVHTIRIPSKKAFFSIQFSEELSESDLLNPETYKNEENYRKIVISDAKPDLSNNIQIYFENDTLQLLDNGVFEKELVERFIDNRSYIGKGQSRKDGTFEILNNVETLPKDITRADLFLGDLYDAMMCDYKQTREIFELDITGRKLFKISMGKSSFPVDEWNKAIESNMLIMHSETKAKGSSSETQGEYFTGRVEEGDIFYLTYGNRGQAIMLIGEITGPSTPDDTLNKGEGWVQRPYEVLSNNMLSKKYKGPKKWWTPNDNGTISEIPLDQYEEANTLLFEKYAFMKFVSSNVPHVQPMEHLKDHPFNLKHPLNQILYGPPGTGKTYQTAKLALQIIGSDSEGNFLTAKKIESLHRETIYDHYKKHVEKGNIDFVTFHQSMSYEDFVEGIKPVMDGANDESSQSSSDQVKYKIEAGIFYQMSAKAAYANHTVLHKAKGKIPFDTLYENYIADLQARISRGEPKVIMTKTNYPIRLYKINKNNSILTIYDESERASPTRPKRKVHLKKIYDAIESVDELDTVKELEGIMNTKGGLSSYYAVFDDLKKFEKEFDPRNYDEDEEGDITLDSIIEDYRGGVYSGNKFNPNAPKKVLIIDEINRANVSGVFGELITLLEKDKRAGMDNEVSLTLPYSKSRFQVPPNLYIIGTMNTADRSVEALDSALRRRFSFKEVMPNPDILESNEFEWFNVYGHSLTEMLTLINKRIEALIDRDHTIGHSYFMFLEDEEAIIAVFTDKIIPLLQEYFYNDYSKIELVLGSGFIGSEDKDQAVTFADTKYTPDIDPPPIKYFLKSINSDNIKEALDLLMNIKES